MLAITRRLAQTRWLHDGIYIGVTTGETSPQFWDAGISNQSSNCYPDCLIDCHQSILLKHIKTILTRYLLNMHYISLLLFAFVLWFLLINYVSVLAHFITVIIVCWGGWVLTESTTLFYQPLHLASHKICIIWYNYHCVLFSMLIKSACLLACLLENA